MDNADAGERPGHAHGHAFSPNHRDHCGGFVRLAWTPSCLPGLCAYGFSAAVVGSQRRSHRAADTCRYVNGRPADGRRVSGQQGITGFRLLPGDVFSLGDGVYLVGNFPIDTGMEIVHPASVMEMPDGSMVRDTFRDEQVCVIKTARGLVVLTGCAHNGIINILRTVQQRFSGERIIAVFGGTHLVPPNEERIGKTAAFFAESGIDCVGVCHCTGPNALAVISQQVPGYVRTGTGFTWQTED